MVGVKVVMVDWDHAHRLLNIVNLARQWPNLKWLHDAAMEELAKGDPNALREIKTTPVEVPDPPAQDKSSAGLIRRC